jgi:hypothetical protein
MHDYVWLLSCVCVLMHMCVQANKWKPGGHGGTGLGGGGMLGGSLLGSLTFNRGEGEGGGSQQRARPKGLTLPPRRK